MKYIIYKNKKSPTQSGKLHKDFWILEHINEKGYKTDLLTGWKTTETNLKKKMKFLNEEEAVSYAKKNNLDFEILKEVNKEISNKSYADNFKFKRIRTDIQLRKIKLSQKISKGIKDLLSDANQVVTAVSIEKCKSVQKNKNYVFVDLRDYREKIGRAHV